MGAGLLVYGGITTRGGDGLNRTFSPPIGWPKVRPDFRPAKGLAGLPAIFSAETRGG